MSSAQLSNNRRLTVLGISNIPMWGMGHKGGMPSVYWGQKGFEIAGHEIHLLLPAGSDRGEPIEDGIHLHYVRVPFTPLSPRNIWLHRFSIKIYWLTFVILAIYAAIGIAKKIKPDVVYGHTSYGAPVAWFVGRMFGIPNITRLYGTFLFPILSNPIRLFGKCEEVIAFKLPASFLIVTDDGTGGRDVARRFGVDPDKVKYWRNGVHRFANAEFDRDSFVRNLGLSTTRKLVITASRLAEWKKVDRLICAIPEIVTKYNEVTFVILGDGPDRERLEGLVTTLGVSKYVKFAGNVPQSLVADYMNAADIFVSLFDLSNVSNAVQEALVCGKCVVALNTGETSNLILNNENGVLINTNELLSLPTTIANLLLDDNWRNRLGEGAIKYAIKYLPTWESRAKMEVSLIEALVSRKGDD